MNNIFDKTKGLLGLTVTGAAVLPMLASCAAGEAKPEKPMNILFIMCDDHSYQTISAYDSTFIRTPNIDRIAADGVRCKFNQWSLPCMYAHRQAQPCQWLHRQQLIFRRQPADISQTVAATWL